MSFIIKLLINAVAVFGAAYLLPGVHVKNFTTAIMVALVLAVLNMILKPVLIVLTIPITIVTLGLFLLVINAILVKLCAYFVKGFSVDGWLYAIVFSIIVSIFAMIMENIIDE